MTAQPAPQTLAILGGGQLGRMLGLAAVPLGVRCRFLDPSDQAGAGTVGELIVGELDDRDAIAALRAGATALTYEWEGVPASSLQPASDAGVFVAPSVAALRTSQDRGTEKVLLASLGIETAPYRLVNSRSELKDALDALGAPAILKTCQGGYDGKGQVRIIEHSAAAIDAAWAALGDVALVLEGFVEFERELSILACRGRDGETVSWPLTENEHHEGILAVSQVPAERITEALQTEADSIAQRLMESLDYVGVICIELFQVDNQLIANEFAPRVHNSGHWTIEGSETSQFENHVRAVLGMPLGSTAMRSPTTMLNAIGALPDRDAILEIPGVHFHSYDKAPRAGRKVGHVTVTNVASQRDDRVEQVRALIETASARLGDCA